MSDHLPWTHKPTTRREPLQDQTYHAVAVYFSVRGRSPKDAACRLIDFLVEHVNGPGCVGSGGGLIDCWYTPDHVEGGGEDGPPLQDEGGAARPGKQASPVHPQRRDA